MDNTGRYSGLVPDFEPREAPQTTTGSKSELDGGLACEVDMRNKQIEQEANRFAIELLMPEDMVRREAAGVDMLDEKAVADIARKFKVPITLMASRILELSQAS